MRELGLWMLIRALGLVVRVLLKLSSLLEKVSQRLSGRIVPILNALGKEDPS